MSGALLAGAGLRQRLAAAVRQCSFVKPAAAVQSHRWLSTTPSDEFNREMAALFGAPPGGDKPQGAGAAAAAAAEVASSSGGQLMSDVQDFNAELSGVLGAASEHEGNDASAAAAASSLSRQLAAAGGSAAGRAATPPSRPTSTSSSGGNCSIAGPYGSFAGSSSGSSSSDAGGRLTHVDAAGKAAMVDVSHKRDTVRTAVAAARVVLGRHVFELVASNQLAKGDVLTVAQLAGVMGAKHTSALIPLCHNILLSKVHVALSLAPEAAAVDVRAEATTVGPTGVEMEALTAAAVAALTVYDMCKAASKGVVITDLRLLAKSGGKSGDWEAGGGGA